VYLLVIALITSYATTPPPNADKGLNTPSDVKQNCFAVFSSSSDHSILQASYHSFTHFTKYSASSIFQARGDQDFSLMKS